MEKRDTIGVLIGNAHTSHPKGLMKGICDSVKGKDVDVVFFLGTQTALFYREMLQEDYDYQYNTIYDYAMLAQVDVLIIAYGSLCIFWEDSDKDKFISHFGNIPYVLLEDVVTDNRGVHIIADNYGGMKACIEHLISVHDCKNICYLSGPKDNQDASERIAAYRDVMRAHGLAIDEKMIVYGNYSEYVDEEVEQLLRDNPDMDALASANDEMTTAIYRVFEKHGIRVGKDIAVTGFDNTDMSAHAKPPLTTILQDSYKMGQKALDMACDVCNGRTVESGRLATDFIQRESCGCEFQTSILEESISTENGEYKDLLDVVKELREFQRMAWMGPFLMRGLAQITDDSRHFYIQTVRAMEKSGATSTYLYLLKRPLIYRKGEEWKRPSRLFLTASCVDGKANYYASGQRPIVRKGSGMICHQKQADGAHVYMDFLLFEGTRQYGILSVEIEPEAIPYFYMLSMQLGTSLRFFELSQRERATNQKLKDKNEVLSFVAIYDELTGIYNRRGILEQIIQFNRRHKGKKAYLLFGDLDHLKEINDTFGHSEGDCAIRTVAGIMKDALGNYGDIGRFGGDEFVGIFLTDTLKTSDYVDQIHDACEEYNDKAGKPYYVNISLGTAEFVCGDNADFKAMLQHADRFLYEEKKNRRATIKKQV